MTNNIIQLNREKNIIIISSDEPFNIDSLNELKEATVNYSNKINDLAIGLYRCIDNNVNLYIFAAHMGDIVFNDSLFINKEIDNNLLIDELTNNLNNLFTINTRGL